MTNPKIQTAYRGGSRWYVHPETSERVPGVTSIIGTLPKPALKPWAAKVVATTAVERASEVAALIAAGEAQGAIDFLKRAPDRESAEAAELGTAAHCLMEAMSLGTVPDLARWPERFRGPLARVGAHFSAFLDEFQPEFIRREDTVWSDTHGYAGSFDAMVSIGGEPIVLDYKTGRSGVYGEVALQLAAYRYADYILEPDGSTSPIPALEGAGVLWITPDKWALYPVRADEEVFETFLALRRHVFPWEHGGKRTVLGKALGGAGVRR